MRYLPAEMQTWEGCLALIPPNESIERPPGRCGDERLEEKRKKKKSRLASGIACADKWGYQYNHGAQITSAFQRRNAMKY